MVSHSSRVGFDWFYRTYDHLDGHRPWTMGGRLKAQETVLSNEWNVAAINHDALNQGRFRDPSDAAIVSRFFPIMFQLKRVREKSDFPAVPRKAPPSVCSRDGFEQSPPL